MATSDKEAQRDRWKDVFPFEITYFRSMILSGRFVWWANVGYGLYSFGATVYVVFVFITRKYDESSTSMLFLENIQGITFLVIPYTCYWFMMQIISNPDLNNLIAHAIEVDSRLQLKFASITHLNFLCLLAASSLYTYQSTYYSDVPLVLMLCIFYLGPLTTSVCLAVCIIELHRIQMQQFRQEINDARARIDIRFWNQTIQTDANREEAKRESEIEMNHRYSAAKEQHFSADSDNIASNSITELRDKYYCLYAVCSRSSQSFGLYLLFFIYFGFLYAMVTIYSIYLSEYSTRSLVGFVICGFFVALGLGAAITACNETGHLICRDLTSYLMSLPCLEEISCVTSDTSDNIVNLREGNSGVAATKESISDTIQDALILMSAMSFMKLQICYFGNMALRASLSFAVLGSVLVAVIPALIQSEG